MATAHGIPDPRDRRARRPGPLDDRHHDQHGGGRPPGAHRRQGHPRVVLSGVGVEGRRPTGVHRRGQPGPTGALHRTRCGHRGLGGPVGASWASMRPSSRPPSRPSSSPTAASTGPGSVSVASTSDLSGAVTLAVRASNGTCWFAWQAPDSGTWYGARTGGGTCAAEPIEPTPTPGVVSSSSVGWSQRDRSRRCEGPCPSGPRPPARPRHHQAPLLESSDRQSHRGQRQPGAEQHRLDGRRRVVEHVPHRLLEVSEPGHPRSDGGPPTVGTGPDGSTGRPPRTRASAVSTSSTSRIGVHPSTSRPLVPREAELRTEPGTAPTGTPRRAAASTVWNEPPRPWHSTTTTTSARAAMMRLRAGKTRGRGGVPSAASDSTAPRRATSCQSAALALG